MFNDRIIGEGKVLGESIGITHRDGHYCLILFGTDATQPIQLIFDDNDNKKEAINILTGIKNWLDNGNDGDVILCIDKDNQEYQMGINETLFTKSIEIVLPNSYKCWMITRRMLNKAIRILKSW